MSRSKGDLLGTGWKYKTCITHMKSRYVNFHCTPLSWTGLLHSMGSRESFWCESFPWDLYTVAICRKNWKKKKKSSYISLCTCVEDLHSAGLASTYCWIYQISVSRSAESSAFPVNYELMLSANAFWTVPCTVNSQGWNSLSVPV